MKKLNQICLLFLTICAGSSFAMYGGTTYPVLISMDGTDDIIEIDRNPYLMTQSEIEKEVGNKMMQIIQTDLDQIEEELKKCLDSVERSKTKLAAIIADRDMIITPNEEMKNRFPAFFKAMDEMQTTINDLEAQKKALQGEQERISMGEQS